MREPAIGFPYSLAVVSFPLRSAIQRMTETSPVVENGANVAENVPVNENDGKNVPINTDGAKDGAKSGAKKTPRQEAILLLMISNPTISLDEIAKDIGIGTSTLDREIERMAHLVRRVGPKRGGHWEIIES